MSTVIIKLAKIYSHLQKLEKQAQWTPGMKSVVPVNTRHLVGFHQFVNANGFQPQFHPGFDFIAYEKTDGELIIALPNGTPVVAIMDGIVLEIIDPGKSYFAEIFVAHALSDQILLLAVYKHAKPYPALKAFQAVKQGEIIGSLTDPDDSYLDGEYHLHIELQRTDIRWQYDEPYLDKRMCFTVDPQPIIFANKPIPNARIDYPNIELCEKPIAPNWPTRFLTIYNAMKWW